jgi:2-(1,2-epoxy-1,2-dihydrophenyl)acetyl-CoA isomerase
VLTEHADGVLRIRLNRPAVLNALDEAMALALRDAVRAAAGNPAIRVVVLSGEGRAFMAGGDIAVFHQAGADAPKAVLRLIEPLHETVRLLAALPQPVIASLQGPVAGAGMSLALAADLAIAADDVRLNLAYARLGTSPDGSASWSLPRLVGLRKAMEIALLADAMDAPEALRLGLVNRVVPLADLAGETDALARRLAAGPGFAYGRIKGLLRGAHEATLAGQLDAEAAAFAACAGTRDFAEGVAAFLAKRPARFEGA